MNSTKSHQKRNVIRFTARALTIIWGAVWLSFHLRTMFGDLTHAMDLLMRSVMILIILWIVFIPFRWEGAGGVILLLSSLLFLTPTLYFIFRFGVLLNPPLRSVLLALPPFIAGIMFLISWKKSKRVSIQPALKRTIKILGNRKKCPKCGFPFSWSDAWRGGHIWNQWQCELCKSTIGYSKTRRMIAVVIAVALSYLISMNDYPFFVTAIFIVLAWITVFYLIDGVRLKEKKPIH